MHPTNDSPVQLAGQAPARDAFLDDVLAGLGAFPKRIPSKYFYDEEGSRLFDAICELDEYYPTRTELSIMDASAGAMADTIGAGAVLIELGSGSSVKTRLLLEQVPDLAAYVPVDISRRHLHKTATALDHDFPALRVHPVAADFTRDFRVTVAPRAGGRRVVYFPGSTIGNFPANEALGILQRIRTLAGDRGGLLIGIDLCKPRQILEAAYNDALGVTAAFNLNLLRRINRELDGDFRIDQFRHQAIYNEQEGRIEMYLISRQEQSATIQGQTIGFGREERILTEYSHKYTPAGFAALAGRAGWRQQRDWQDSQGYFSVVYLEAA